MKNLFPKAGGVSAWHRTILGENPFSCDREAAVSSFFRPAARLCRKAVAAEKTLPICLPAALREKLCMALRLWQASLEVTEDFALKGILQPGMDMPMTLNFAMALGNYSRFFLFSGPGRLPPEAALVLHAAFADEMTAMPAALAAQRTIKAQKQKASGAFAGGRNSPSASALRIATACAGVFNRKTL